LTQGKGDGKKDGGVERWEEGGREGGWEERGRGMGIRGRRAGKRDEEKVGGAWV
jgi:hypothetical protein